MRKVIFFLFLTYVNVLAQDTLHLIASLSGDRKGDCFSVVSGLNDINGDGYGDFLVGAPGGNYAKLYMGAEPFDTVAFICLCPPGSAAFGETVAGGSDLNGDGYADFIVGAPYSSSGPPDFFEQSGKVFVYFGGPQFDGNANLILEGSGWYYHFGASLSIAGDVNGDGIKDIVIGAPNDDINGRGRGYIYFGGASMDDTPDVYLEGQEGADAFGCSVSSCGDVNKDGYDDVLIGASQRGSAKSIGKAYLIYGGSEITLMHSVIFIGDSIKQEYGRFVAGLGDINNDGFKDFGIMSMGYARIISGNGYSTLFEMNGLPENGAFINISGVDDFNNDHFADFVISTEKFNNSLTGGVFVFLGKSNTGAVPDIGISGPLLPSCFGSSISYSRTMNGKNYILIGDDQSDGWEGPGIVYIYSHDKDDNVEDNKYHKPDLFHLNQNFPNPFNSSTMLSYEINAPCFLKIDIMNCYGFNIRNLFFGQRNVGYYSTEWDGTDEYNNPVCSGIYLAKISGKGAGKSCFRDFTTIKITLTR
ncbi:MAG: FG-GAP-like repeat-containing protein [bacterium]|nr:FG-GAP-like repeat-containing protein [bacterium]